jgi:hypothetical protein
MEWIIDSSTQALISPLLARSFHVIPLAETEHSIELLIGLELTESERREKQAQLEFYLGRPVTLHTLAEFPGLEGGFNEILDRYYGTPFPEMLSKPVGRHVATVLLLDPIDERRKDHKNRLICNGFIVFEAASTDQALARLQAEFSGITEILLPPQPWGRGGGCTSAPGRSIRHNNWQGRGSPRTAWLQTHPGLKHADMPTSWFALSLACPRPALWIGSSPRPAQPE